MSYERVPKDLLANMEYRAELLEKCGQDRGFARGVKELCRQDILFWVNSFLWTYDPRLIKEGENPEVPFVTYPFQDGVLLELQGALGHRDVGIEKSRDMGASWMCLVVMVHEWQFKAGRSFMLVSRNERLVDAQTDSDSLFWKIDFMLGSQPKFLLMDKDFVRTKLHLYNKRTKSSIDGASTTADVGRGGRRTAILLDEYGAFEVGDSHAANAATQATTNCRVFNSTYKGAVGAFYEAMQREDIKKISLPWTLHPEKVKGRYEGAGGKTRSPWYDLACKRLIVPGLIAQELDMDPQGAASMFYPVDLLDRLIQEVVRPPVLRGELVVRGHDIKSGEWVEDNKGHVLLWCNLKEGKPAQGETYVMGADISAGTGATNSVVSVAEVRTREKVAEYANPRLSPDKFAEAVVALAWWFNEAYLIWELNGPGQIFGKRVVGLDYTNFYLKRDEKGLLGTLAKGMIPGWYASKESKLALHGEYVRALSNGSFVNRSLDSLQECRQYVYMASGGIENARASAIQDPSGARDNHGDRPTADALANKALGSEPDAVQLAREKDPFSLEGEADYGGWKWRRQKEQAERQGVETGRGWELSPQELAGW